MMRRLALRLGADLRGNASVEFALVALFFFGIVMVALDFGVYAQQRLKLASAVEGGAVLAFNMRDSLNSTAVANYVQAAASLPAAPTVNCNEGTACAAKAGRAATDYRCINPLTGAIDSATKAIGATCASGGNAGYYLKIVANQTFTSVVVPDRWLGGSTITQTAVVRLQ